MLTKKVGTPAIVELKSIAKEPKEEEYSSGFQITGLLTEGLFNSMYTDRVKPFSILNFRKKSLYNKMVVISDGDIGRNQLQKGKPFDLAKDKWTGEQFGNKEFLLNAIDYLLDDNGLIELRNKNIQINLLDKKKAYQEKTYWQFVNIILPLMVLLTFGLVFQYLRKRKYS
jgi:gliding-associated putative ABC transporter substrate-binding component GldG